MFKLTTFITIVIFFIFSSTKLIAQSADRFASIEQKLQTLSVDVPGLEQKVQLNVSGISLQQYLNALAKANNLSISIDPKLNFIISDNFNDVTALNILVFLSKKYNLDLSITGSIIYVTPYVDPSLLLKAPEKEISAKYNQLENTLFVDLNNDSLVSVAKKITRISGRNVIVPSPLQNKTVSAFIQGASFETAMEKIAFLNGLKMVKTADNYYLFQALEDNEELYINGDKNTSVRHVFKPINTNNRFSGLTVKSLNGQMFISVDANDVPIADLLQQSSQELNKNYSVYSEIKGTITIHVSDVPYDTFLSLLFKGTPYSFRSENNVYIIGDSKMEGLRSFKVIQLQNRSIDTVVSMLPTEWRQGIDIKEFKEQNTLLLSGSISRIEEMESYIKQLDVLVPVVLIEVTMIDINKSRNVTTGISAGVSDSVKTGGSILPGMNFTFSTSSINNFLNSVGKITSINLGHVVPNFYVSLKALEANNNVDVRSVPKLTALNGHPAFLSIGNSVYYKNSTQNVIPSAATSQTLLTNTYIETDANMSINITPVVAGDDQINMGIKIDISDFTSLPTDGSPPPKSTSKYGTSLRVNNGDMILLGGIERTERDDSQSGFPILSRIPILKYIFSNKSKTTTKVVTVLFIKATIMR